LGEIILAEKDKNSQKISKSMIARILVLFLTAFIGMGFIYTMLYKGIVYEALFGNEGYFSKFEGTSSAPDKTPGTSGTSTPEHETTPEPTATIEPSSTETPEPTPDPTPSFEPIKREMEGARVQELQTLLTVKGYLSYEYITSYFGSITENAVKKFQQENGLPVTGIVDEETMEKLKAAEDVM
jgi:hypothetical protein